ncbi:SapC family protein [Synechococcus sp. CS-1328]|uniref:SapC family protein n=1 Tax=Synechococcus sp. CS-1328 TaxID=2847976 RepID=UPI00223AA491|nr:SapC family protein [Synechococcus sp. CS-1328]MCT0226322.1 SapC family protein [Synechococcus sp. CS-1328]
MATQLLFYNDVSALSAERHKDWHIVPVKDYSFAKTTNAVPLMAIEFLNAAGDYPIVFVGTDDDVMPVILLGLQQSENLYLSPDGHWEGKYVPAFIRRYPFVLSQAGDQDKAYLCIDESYPGFNQNHEGIALIGDDGKASDYTDGILRFLSQFQAEYQRTKVICKRLKELNLLEPKEAEAKLPNGQTKAMNGFYTVERSRVLTLSSDVLLDLVRTGVYEMICHHLASLRNFNTLGNMGGIQASTTDQHLPV